MIRKEYKAIIVEMDGPIARIIFNRPEKLNAINMDLMDETLQALKDIDRDEETKIIIIKGNGRAFCAGFDLSSVAYSFDTEKTPMHRDRDWVIEEVTEWRKLWDIRKPVIAQVHGYCYAGGGTIAGFSDLIYASNDALFGQPQARTIGFTPELANWPLTIGMRKTKELLLTGDSITGEEAERIGMINKALPPEELEDYVERLAQRIALGEMDMLTYKKHAVNQVYEIMGLTAMIQSGVNFDIFAHHSMTSKRFQKTLEKYGLNAAIEEMNAPWGSAAKK